MPIVAACARGHVTKFDNRLAGCTVRCPECDEMLQVPERKIATPESARPRPKGLWGVMQKSTDEPAGKASEPPAAEPPSAASAKPAPKTRPAKKPSEPPPKAKAKAKSLWDVMAKPAEAAAEEAGGPLSIHDVPAKVDKRLQKVDKRLRTVPPPTELPKVPEPIAKPESVEDDDADDDEIEDFDEDEASDEAIQKPASPRVAPVPAAPPGGPPVSGAPLPRSWKAVCSVALGAVAVPFTALAIIPSIWSSLPAGLMGIAALLLGLTAQGEIRRSRGRMSGRGLAAVGAALGIAGALLGPMVLSRLGIWESIARRETQSHLESIGRGLAGYERINSMYPSGGTFVQNSDGKTEARHSWMTALLPFMGYQSVYEKIDLQKPWDSPDNLLPLHNTIPEFLAAGGNPTPINNLGVSHFAGLGGEIALPDGSFGHVGIFGENSEVMREDITGGLSQTLIVGEVASDYPAWGSPRNWRQIGQGLNRSQGGFGNAAGSGAMFLAADGSVRFFSNRTDPEILRQMSQRDREAPAEPAAAETPAMPAE
jgi:hypothetical protein